MYTFLGHVKWKFYGNANFAAFEANISVFGLPKKIIPKSQELFNFYKNQFWGLCDAIVFSKFLIQNKGFKMG